MSSEKRMKDKSFLSFAALAQMEPRIKQNAGESLPIHNGALFNHFQRVREPH